MLNRVRVLFAVVLAAVILPGGGAGFTQSNARAQAQTPVQGGTSAAVITGTIIDKDGGFIPGATVVLTKVGTSEKLPAQVTNQSGQYSFPALAPGKYKLTVSLQGFKTLTVDVTVGAGSINTLGALKLEVGALTEVINVVAGTDIVRADTPTVTQTVSANFVQTLPREDRNALSYLIFLPGVTTVGGAPSAPPTTIAGLPNKQYNVTIDGVVSPPAQLQATDAVQHLILQRAGVGGETYAQFIPNPFYATLDQPLSTFGADVDTASYSNIRRYPVERTAAAGAGRARRRTRELLPLRVRVAARRPADRTDDGNRRLSVGADAQARAHWRARGRAGRARSHRPQHRPAHRRVGIDGAAGAAAADQDRARTVRRHAAADDTVAIVTYAGTSGVALPPTPARQRDVIQHAIARSPPADRPTAARA